MNKIKYGVVGAVMAVTGVLMFGTAAFATTPTDYTGGWSTSVGTGSVSQWTNYALPGTLGIGLFAMAVWGTIRIVRRVRGLA